MQRVKEIVGIGTIVYILCLYLAFILYSPTIAFNAIREAIQLKDAASLERYVDFKSVQDSVKLQIKTELILNASRVQKESGQSSQQLINEVAAASSLVDDFIDSFVSQEGLSRLFKIDLEQSKKSRPIDTEKYVSMLQSEEFIGQGDFNYLTFGTIQMSGYTDQGNELKFIFAFRYLKWVLTDIRIDLGNVENQKIVQFMNNFRQAAESVD